MRKPSKIFRTILRAGGPEAGPPASCIRKNAAGVPQGQDPQQIHRDNFRTSSNKSYLCKWPAGPAAPDSSRARSPVFAKIAFAFGFAGPGVAKHHKYLAKPRCAREEDSLRVTRWCRNLCYSVLVVFSILPTGMAYALTPQEILEKVDEIRAPANTFTFHLKVTVNKDDQDSKAEFFVRVKDARKSLVIYKSPPSNKGRVLLLVENNMWIYIPGTRNSLRISPQQQIMGRVSNADAARVVFSLDYSADSATEDVLDGRKVLQMSLTAKTTGAAYKNITLWVENENYQPIKAKFFALSGKLLKTAYYKEYKDILGKKRPTVLEIHDGIRESEVSVMEYSDLMMEDTPDAYYQKTFMDRVE